MSYQKTVTSKGQVVIPKNVRDFLNIGAGKKITFNINKKRNEVVIKPVSDILDLAGQFKPKKKISALKAREEFEKNYERA